MNGKRRATGIGVGAAFVACVAFSAWSRDQAYQGSADDFAQISQLMGRYSFALDGRDPEAFARVFTKDGVFRAAALCIVGHDQLAALVERMGKGRPAGDTRPGAHHVSSVGTIDYVDRDNATAQSFLMLVGDVDRKGVGAGIRVTGVYTDKLTKVNGRWLIADRLEVSPGDEPAPVCPATK